MRYIIYFFGILLTAFCEHSDNKIASALSADTTIKSSASTIDTCHTEITGLEKKDITQLSQVGGCCINIVEDSIEYMPSYTRITKNPVTNPEMAWGEIKNLYPDFVGRIKCWTEYKGYYIFSVGFNEPKTDCMFWNIVYVKKGEKEFKYFWPHT